MQHPSTTAGQAEVYLALGSNLGDRRANLAAAIDRLPPHVTVELVSSIYETEPAYVSDQPCYLNAALRGRTSLDPEALLALLKQIESAVGRVAGPRFGPRVVDLDILLYDRVVVESSELTIPHPRMAERPFVLVPLAEIAPDLVPPGWDDSVVTRARLARGHGDVIAIYGRLSGA